MQVKILLSRSFIDNAISNQLGNVIVHSIISPISPILNQFKEKGLIRNWTNERIVRYILRRLSCQIIQAIFLERNLR